MLQIGRYTVLKELGRGAMGVVYAASDPRIGRTVAVKTIRLANEEGTSPEELRERLMREARAAGVLSHPGIVTIHDVGEYGTEAFIVMEFVDGDNLDRILESDVPQHTDFLTGVIRRAAEALDFAHAKGVVHRDIKPSNIMVGSDGSVKITDFGIAKRSASTSLTQSGMVLGTPSFMSPEQAQGRPIDGRSDQFSLAVVAFRLLTGSLPFPGPSLTAVLSKILWEEPDFRNSSLDARVREVLKRALSKDPARRYPSCGAFAAELEGACSETRPIVAPVAAGPATEEFPATAAAAAPVPAPAVPAEAPDATSGPAPPVEDRGSEARSSAPREPSAREEGRRDLAGAEAPGGVRAGVAAPAASPSSGSARRWMAAVAAVVVLLVLGGLAYFWRPPAPPRAGTSGGAPVAPTPPVPVARPDTPAPPAAAPGGGSEEPAPRPTKVPSGVLRWSGRMPKNSILVITDKASFGALEGALPGFPVSIDVEPAGLQVREAPAESNGWKRLMLYSGAEKHSSITIRWRGRKPTARD